jgi:hypothetical protein
MSTTETQTRSSKAVRGSDLHLRTRLLIRRFWVRVPGGPPPKPQVERLFQFLWQRRDRVRPRLRPVPDGSPQNLRTPNPQTRVRSTAIPPANPSDAHFSMLPCDGVSACGSAVWETHSSQRGSLRLVGPGRSAAVRSRLNEPHTRATRQPGPSYDGHHDPRRAAGSRAASPSRSR